MRLDITKIDERIQRLQELRRIANDPEMAQLLSEFLISENGLSSAALATTNVGTATTAAPEALPHGDGVSDFVKGVLEGKDSSQRGTPLPSWSTRKA